MNLQGEKHVFFMGKTQLVPAGYVVTKNGLGGVGVGPQQNRNSQIIIEIINAVTVKINFSAYLQLQGPI